MCDLEQPLLGRHRAREGALLVAEQLGFEQLAAQPGAVQVHERLVRARTVLVDPARQHSLADPVSPWIKSGSGERATRAASAASFLTIGLSPKKGSTAFRACVVLRASETLPHAARLERALEHHQQRGQLDGLGEELLGALLDRLHRQVDRAVRGQQHDGQRGVLGLERPQHLEAVAVRQREVHDRGVDRLPPQHLADGATSSAARCA